MDVPMMPISLFPKRLLDYALVGHLMRTSPFIQLRPAQAQDWPTRAGARAALRMPSRTTADAAHRPLAAPLEGRWVAVPRLRHRFQPSDDCLRRRRVLADRKS